MSKKRTTFSSKDVELLIKILQEDYGEYLNVEKMFFDFIGV